jgi:membrane-associated protein
MTGLSYFLFHLDEWLQQAVLLHPFITYWLIFFILFTESAFFPVAPFLPGDALLFSIGVLAAGNSFNLWVAIPVLIAGGVLGSGAAFLLGRKFGVFLFRACPKIKEADKKPSFLRLPGLEKCQVPVGNDHWGGERNVKNGSFLLKLFAKFPRLNRNHYEKAHEFYQKHGSMAIFFSRFMPVIRALIPLVAGIAKMDNLKFWKNNVGSVTVWVVLITLTGCKLGHLFFVKHYFGAIVLGVSAISLIFVALVGVRQQFWKKN